MFCAPEIVSDLFFSMERCGIFFLWSSLFQLVELKIIYMQVSQENTKHEFSDPEMHLRAMLFIVLFIYAKEKLTDIQSNRSYIKIAC